MKVEIFEYNANTYLIEIGGNRSENQEIVDASKETDIWFHIEGEPSCHVILKTSENIKEIPRQVIKRCAYKCKINSKAKRNPRTRVIYTKMKNVIQTEIEGQVAVSEYKTVLV
jgi:predicted ribosome quality control (RQC) complex YloA/Tae2 family protein